MWAGASGDYNPIHYDKDFALSKNLPGVVVHGQLVTAFLAQMLARWMGNGFLRKLSVSYKGMNFPGDTITCRAVVSGKSVDDGRRLVNLEIWAENPRSEKTVVGLAVMEL
jgi:acyl dehydratase